MEFCLFAIRSNFKTGACFNKLTYSNDENSEYILKIHAHFLKKSNIKQKITSHYYIFEI